MADEVAAATLKRFGTSATMKQIAGGLAVIPATGLVTDNLGIWLPGDTQPRVALGAPFGRGSVGFNDAAGDPVGLIQAANGLLNVTQAGILVDMGTSGTISLSESGSAPLLATAFDGDTDIRAALGSIAGAGALAVGDGAGGVAFIYYLDTARIALFNTALQGSVVRRTVAKTAAWTWALTERDAVITSNSSGSVAATIPPNSSVAFAVGQELRFTNIHASGSVVITPGAGVTINHPTGFPLTIAGQYSHATIRQTSTDTWTLIESTDALGLALMFQPVSALLTAIGGVTSAADKLMYFTGSNTAAVTTLTGFGRTLIDDVDAAAGLLTLGGAPLAAPTFTGIVSATGGRVNVSDGTAGHGEVVVGVSAFGPVVSLYGSTADDPSGTVKAALQATGLQLGPGGVAATDVKILRTGVAALNVTGLATFLDGLGLTDAKDIAIAATTGSKVGQSNSKIGFFGATPIVQPAATVAPRDALVNLGLLAAHDTLDVARSLRDRYFAPNAASPCYETGSRGMISNSAGPASGTVCLSAIALPKGMVVNRISFTSITTGASVPTHWWFSLCDNTFTTLRSTADQTTTAWAASTEKRIALSSAFTTTYEGIYYLAFMMTATIVVSLATIVATAQFPTSLAPLIGLTGTTGMTTAPADATLLAASPTVAIQRYAYVD